MLFDFVITVNNVAVLISPSLFFDETLRAIATMVSQTLNFIPIRDSVALSPGVAGEYNSLSDYMWFPFAINTDLSVEQEGTIVHESVHAGCDIYSVALSNQDNEAVAFIAQEIYLAARWQQISSRSTDVRSPGIDRLRYAAQRIVTDLQARRSSRPNSNPTVDSQLLNALRAEIVPVYQGLLPNWRALAPALNNGLLGGWVLTVPYRRARPRPPLHRRPRTNQHP